MTKISNERSVQKCFAKFYFIVVFFVVFGYITGQHLAPKFPYSKFRPTWGVVPLIAGIGIPSCYFSFVFSIPVKRNNGWVLLHTHNGSTTSWGGQWSICSEYECQGIISTLIPFVAFGAWELRNLLLGKNLWMDEQTHQSNTSQSNQVEESLAKSGEMKNIPFVNEVIN